MATMIIPILAAESPALTLPSSSTIVIPTANINIFNISEESKVSKK